MQRAAIRRTRDPIARLGCMTRMHDVESAMRRSSH
jgi:hypothetical protein